MNYENIDKVRNRIAAVGEDHCDMGSWFYGPTDASAMPGEGEPECGTTACIAGHALAIKYGKLTDERSVTGHVADDAIDWLGLDVQKGEYGIFYMENWKTRYRVIARDEGHAKAMVRVLDDLVMFGAEEVLVNGGLLGCP